jgi:hypothetical protein
MHFSQFQAPGKHLKHMLKGNIDKEGFREVERRDSIFSEMDCRECYL